MAVISPTCLCPSDHKEMRSLEIRAKQRERYLKNRLSRLAKAKAHYASNREAILGRVKQYTITNKDKITERRRIRYTHNRDEILARRREEYRRNPGKINQRNAAWASENRCKINQIYRNWCENNRERARAISAKWREQNRGVSRARVAAAQAMRKKRAHPELDGAVVSALFLECARVSAASGIKHHVDHIIPLAAGGWHHHFNLQLLPASLNLAKNDDPFWTREGYKSWRDVPDFLWPEKLAATYRSKISEN